MNDENGTLTNVILRTVFAGMLSPIHVFSVVYPCNMFIFQPIQVNPRPWHRQIHSIAIGLKLQSVSPGPWSSLFPICSVALYNFLTKFFSDYFFTFPNIPENFVDFFCVLAKLDHLACNNSVHDWHSPARQCE